LLKWCGDNTILKGEKMGKCSETCKHLELYDDGLKGYETAETGGHCVKFNKMVYFGEECPDYESKDKQKQ
jgi:hypothetical protein